MDNKFYVTFKTAKLLKEKGFNKAVDKLIHLNKYTIPIIESPEKYYDETGVYNDYLYLKQNHYACPTKSEVIDWLESKGIVIEVQYRKLTGKYFSEIHYNKMRYKGRSSDLTEDYKVRLEAEEAAIIKACELL